MHNHVTYGAPIWWVIKQVLVNVMVHLVHLVRTPPTISDHLRLHLPTLRCHSNAHCISLHNHATPVTRLNSDQCLISLNLVPLSCAPPFSPFPPYPTFTLCLFFIHI